jgi:hypothetical protein
VTTVTLTALPAAASAQIQVRRGSEFQVNAYTTGLQWEPAVAVGPGGDFVVAWASKVPNESQKIMARRFGPSGAPAGPELVVGTGVGEQRSPAVTSTRDGEFVVVWSGGNIDAGDGLGIFGRVIDASGQLVGPEFLVNEYTPGAQWEPAIAADAAGNITVAWSGDGGDWDYDGISARRLTHRGQPLTPQVEVNTWIAGVQSRPAVASTPEGDFTVLWQGAPSDRVYARRFTAEGTPILSPFHINTNMDPYSGPAAACDADGNVFMASTGVGADGDGAGVNGLRMLSNGGFDAGEFVVNSYTVGSQSAPSVAEYGGNFVVVWTSIGQDGDWDGVYGQRYDADLQRIGFEFRINSYTTNYQYQPAVASDAQGNWVAVWTSGPAGRDGDSSGIFAQPYAPDRIFDSGFEAGGLAGWSASNADGGDLSVTTAAALNGFRGLQGVVDDTAGLWVQDDTPADEPRYRARFYFDTNGFDPGEALNKRRVILFVAFEENPNRRLVTIVLRRLNGAYSVRGTVRLDDHTLSVSPFMPISDGPHYVEFDWRRSSGPDEEDGLFALWLDGTVVHAAPNIDNSLSAVDFVRLGAITVKPGASGTLYWDHFRSRRVSPLGSF